MSVGAYIKWLFGRRKKMKFQVRGHRVILKRLPDTGFEYQAWFRDKTVTAEVVGVGELVGVPDTDSLGLESPNPSYEVGDIVIAEDSASGGLEIGQHWFAHGGSILGNLTPEDEKK